MEKLTFAFILPLLSVMVLTVGCTRGQEGPSRLTLVMPPHPTVSEKSANYTPQADAYLFCYLVNITGDGIKGEKQSCTPEAGARTAFLAPLSEASLDVDRGAYRTVELFGYIPREGETCNSSGIDLLSVPVNRLYRLAVQKKVPMTDPEVTVHLTAVFPGTSNHFGLQANLDSSCYSALPPVTIPATPPLASVFRGKRFMMTGQVGGDGRPVRAQGSRFHVTHEVIYVR